jgi:antitoxin component YwqK of YwqJK toxin-antitoxin module
MIRHATGAPGPAQGDAPPAAPGRGCRPWFAGTAAAIFLWAVAAIASQPHDYRDGIFYRRGSEEPFTGTAYPPYADGRPRAAVAVVEGRSHGPLTIYYPWGGIWKTYEYREGVLDGPFQVFAADGSLMERGTFRQGVLDGPYEVFFPGGRPRRRMTFRNGLAEGAYQEWRADGHLVREGAYLRGLAHGAFRSFDRPGHVVLEKRYRDGVFLGMERYP